MDSISQIVLGASVAHLALGDSLGKRALILGAVVATLPDLDVLVPYTDAIESYTYHRSWSHSILMLTLFSFVLAAFFQCIQKETILSFKRWWFGLWLILVTHPLLDGFTVYGTQLWWPLSVPPTAWGSVFIIDPIYTAPLIVCVVIACKRPWLLAKPILIAGLIASTSYLGWTLFAQHITRQKVESTLAESAIVASHIVIAPFPFSLLWRVVVVTEHHYLEGYSSLLDTKSTVSLDIYNNGKQSCKQWLTHWPVQRMDWFTRGAFALSVVDDVLVLSDLRMGVEDDYVFEFAVANWKNDDWQMIATRKKPLQFDAERMKLLFVRITDEHVDLTPLAPSRGAVDGDCSGKRVKLTSRIAETINPQADNQRITLYQSRATSVADLTG